MKKGDWIEFAIKGNVIGEKRTTIAAPIEMINSEGCCWVVTEGGWMKVEPIDILRCEIRGVPDTALSTKRK